MKTLPKMLSILLVIIVSLATSTAQKGELKYYVLKRYFGEKIDTYTIKNESHGDTLTYIFQKVDTLNTVHIYNVSKTNKSLLKYKIINHNNNIGTLFSLQTYFPCLINVMEYKISHNSLEYGQLLSKTKHGKEKIKLYFKEINDPFDYSLLFHPPGSLDREQIRVIAKVKLKELNGDYEKINCIISRNRIIGALPLNKRSLPKPYIENFEIYPITKYRYNELIRKNT